jgi:rubrerythrin
MTTRDKLTNIIKQRAYEEYDSMLDVNCYWLDEYNLTDIVDDMLKSGCVKDNQVYHVQEYDFSDYDHSKKVAFTCPACNTKFGIHKLYQYCPKCGARIKGWRQ